MGTFLGSILVLFILIGFIYLVNKTLTPNSRYDEIRKGYADWLEKNPEPEGTRTTKRR